MLIGLISDTHGLLRQSALSALEGVDRIVHAGDIDRPEILARLNEIAPVFAVRGNIDRHAGLADLPTFDILDSGGGTLIGVVHDIGTLDTDPLAAGLAAVVFGHSHRPKVEMVNGVLFINPGSAGPRRFKLPVAMGLMEIREGAVSARILTLNDD